MAQHHDAVSGTAKQHVTSDYTRRLAAGLAAAHAAALPGLGRLVGATAAAPTSWTVCPLTNVSLCAPTQSLTAGHSSSGQKLRWLQADHVATHRLSGPPAWLRAALCAGPKVALLAAWMPAGGCSLALLLPPNRRPHCRRLSRGLLHVAVYNSLAQPLDAVVKLPVAEHIGLQPPVARAAASSS